MNPPSTGSLQINRGSQVGVTIPLQIGTFDIGRDPTNQVEIPDHEVSRQHARITVDAQGAWIIDLGSTYGTYVNGQQITQSVWLKPGDEIQISSTSKIVYQSSGAAQPQPVSPPQKGKSRSRGRSCLLTCGILLVVFICGLLLVGGGGYYFYSTGQLSPRTVLNAIGQGTGEINIVNIADSTLEGDLIQLTTESGEPSNHSNVSLEPLEVGGMGTIPPGRYELRITFSGGIPAVGSCWLAIESGDVFQLVAVPEGIAISKEGTNTSNPDEVDYQTSSLCKP